MLLLVPAFALVSPVQQLHLPAALHMMATSSSLAANRLLVLGGTGFVGGTIAQEAVNRGYSVTSLSRRGRLDDADDRITWLEGDASDAGTVARVVQEGEFDAVVHAIGMLLDNSLNRFASGSGSVPGEGATYDQVTRQTVFAAADAVVSNRKAGQPPTPFVFVSAAEAAWTKDALFEGTPLAFLRRYLVAKRAAEERLLSDARNLRATVLRPSLVWTKERPAALPAVSAFTAANAIGIPFIDRPVSVTTLAAAAVEALEDASCSGTQNYKGMERLAAQAMRR
ncbi:hypothetical protein JKP88DRAFT_328170 [Tribonema minus]|uniref:NAD(P)-binding domain-containing protein n=1 Tax=Tribonema minus TaxID=303371 RepID=A0A835YPV7_9STRA|nr:hypothetical protein JKP88DRAFT_328170 [Tribonema minus]